MSGSRASRCSGALFSAAFEILFAQPQELVEALSELGRVLDHRFGGRSHVASSTLLWGGESSMVKISFSEAQEPFGGQLRPPGILKALGLVECSVPSSCVEIYDEIQGIVRSRGLRIRIVVAL